MTVYTDGSHVRVRPFARRHEGDSVTIGDWERQAFLAIPAEGLTILDGLATGESVGEARRRYEACYGETPDIEDFLQALESAGFVSAGEDHESHPSAVAPVGFSPRCARRLWSRLALFISAATIAVAAATAISDPATIPSPSVLVFRHYLAAISLGMVAFGLAGVAIHEFAHLVVARAAGVPARIGIGHRLWIVVAETDMTGIWMASKRARYAAFLAGPLVDTVSASVLIAVREAAFRQWIRLSPLAIQVVGAAVMVYLLRLLWQCFLFVRTDFYFVLATAFDCKNLLEDTQDFIHNCVARFLPSLPVADQSAIPAPEMRVVRWYSLLWIAGRAAALFTLFFVTLPIMLRYLSAMLPVLIGGRSRYGLVDIAVFGTFTLGVDGAGLFMWVRSLVRRAIERRSDAMATA